MAILSGRVVEKWTGMPISGALVNVNGMTVIADGSGGFSVDTPHQTANVQVMHVNYTTVSTIVPMRGDTSIELNLVPVVRSL